MTEVEYKSCILGMFQQLKDRLILPRACMAPEAAFERVANFKSEVIYTLNPSQTNIQQLQLRDR